MKKFYFNDIDEIMCYTLDYHINNAKTKGLDNITLIEAIPEKDTELTWCTHKNQVLDKNDCRKANCELYKSNKSGRGVCVHRGKLYSPLKEVTFKIKFNG